MHRPGRTHSPRPTVNRIIETIALRPDLERALRVSVAFTLPLFVGHYLGRSSDAVYVAMAAQALALPDLRGAYGMRLAVLGCMSLVLAGSTLLGSVASGSVAAAMAAMALIALLTSCWRRLSTDYGPSLGVASALLFLLGLAQGGTVAEGWHLAGLALIGGAEASLLHILFWPFRPQYPLRYAVAESWVAASDLASSLRPNLPGSEESRLATTAQAERELRAALDRTFVVLGAAANERLGALLTHLEEARRQAVHFAMRLLALHTALEPQLGNAAFAKCIPGADSLLKALGDTARSVAVTLLTCRPANFSATEIRLKRCADLAQVLEEQIADPNSHLELPEIRAALRRVVEILPQIRASLAKTVDTEGTKVGISARLPDLGDRSIHSLAVWINPSTENDLHLVRHALRMALLTTAAVAVYRYYEIPRGYWIAFTIVVVLQPDYGATRKKAGERIGGTFLGTLLGSCLLWIKLPPLVLASIAGLLSAAFGYEVKRRYAAAVFFVTIMIVLVAETTTPVHLDFTVGRLAANLIGGGAALVAALVFWPAWEERRYASLLAAALRTNGAFLAAIASKAPRIQTLLLAKRKAENANRSVAASLQRLLAEPNADPTVTSRAAAVNTYNQRITRSLIALTVHLPEQPLADSAAVLSAGPTICRAIEICAKTIERDSLTGTEEQIEPELENAEALWQGMLPADGQLQQIEWIHLAKIITELRAMSVAIGG